MKRRRGMTLVELLVGIALVMLVLFILEQLLIPCFRAAERMYARMELAQLGGNVFRHVENDLDQTPFTNIYFPLPASKALVLQPIAGVANDGSKVYSKQLVVYYLDSEKGLHRYFWPPTGSVINVSPLETQVLTPGNLIAMAT